MKNCMYILLLSIILSSCCSKEHSKNSFQTILWKNDSIGIALDELTTAYKMVYNVDSSEYDDKNLMPAERINPPPYRNKLVSIFFQKNGRYIINKDFLLVENEGNNDNSMFICYLASDSTLVSSIACVRKKTFYRPYYIKLIKHNLDICTYRIFENNPKKCDGEEEFFISIDKKNKKIIAFK